MKLKKQQTNKKKEKRILPNHSNICKYIKNNYKQHKKTKAKKKKKEFSQTPQIYVNI